MPAGSAGAKLDDNGDGGYGGDGKVIMVMMVVMVMATKSLHFASLFLAPCPRWQQEVFAGGGAGAPIPVSTSSLEGRMPGCTQ